jgi:hypothetical protein
MKSVAMLKRESVDKDITSDLVESLPDDASRVLGYDVLMERRSRQRLRNALAEMKIKPFTAKSVKKYEQAMLKKYGATFWVRHPNACEVILSISAVLSVVSFSVGLVLLVIDVATRHFGLSRAMEICNAFDGICAVGIPSLICLFGVGLAKGKKDAVWRFNDIRGYNKEIPSFALETAISVKKAIPEAEIRIKTLIQENAEIDPFLVVSAWGEDYYLEVWDEPGFEYKQREI